MNKMKTLILTIALLNTKGFSLNFQYKDGNFGTQNPSSLALLYNPEQKIADLLATPEHRNIEILLNNPFRYALVSKNLRSLPIMNGALVAPEWFITATHSLDVAMSGQLGDFTSLLTMGAKIGDHHIQLTMNTIKHDTLDLCLVKVKKSNDLPIIPIHRDPKTTLNSNVPKLFFSRTIHYSGNEGAPMLPNAQEFQNLENHGWFSMLKGTHHHSSEEIHTNYQLIDTLGYSTLTYGGDSGSPILVWTNSQADLQLESKNPQQHTEISGIYTTSNPKNITAVNLTNPEINAWVDYNVLNKAIE